MRGSSWLAILAITVAGGSASRAAVDQPSMLESGNAFQIGDVLGSCCIDGTCHPNVTQSECEADCGTWRTNPSCAGTFPCGPMLAGVCCLNGICDDTLGVDSCTCQGGTFMGSFSCTGVECPPPPTGACCIDGGCTPNLTESECEVDFCGNWQGEGSNCNGPLICGAVLVGVCCLDGACTTSLGMDSCQCQGGTFMPGTNSCTGVICQGGPAGACCIDGSCTDGLTRYECEVDQCGFWHGEGSTCDTTPFCPVQEVGVCCLGDVCTDGLGADECECAGGEYLPGVTSCDSVVCNEPVGRCCLGGSCSELTQAECQGICGVWAGAGTNCGTGGTGGTQFPCVVAFGACCVGTSCQGSVGPQSCSCMGGTWHSGESCALNPANDCDGNGLIDICEGFEDCNTNGVPDPCDISSGTSDDCNTNGIPDECDLDPDCSLNEPIDCNFDGVLNGCDPDCNTNGLSDICDFIGCDQIECGTLFDCTGSGGLFGNFVLGMSLHQANCQSCHGFGGYGETAPNHRNFSRYYYQWKTSGCVFHTGGTFNFTIDDYANLQAYLSDLGEGGNGIPDECEGITDCDLDGIADVCELAGGLEQDCNTNGLPDNCDITGGTSEDCNTNGVPDECEGLGDCNTNGIPDVCEGLPDCNTDGVPDECDPDCNTNGLSDICDILGGATDCDGNWVPDECEEDCNTNGIVDACDITSGFSLDLNDNGIPDECEPDCNSNGIPDDLDLAPGETGKTVVVNAGTNGLIADCDGNGGGGGPYESTVNVDFGADCASIEHMTVLLNISHTWVGDLVAELESPGGTVVTLMSRPGLLEIDPFCAGGECCGNSTAHVWVRLRDEYPTSTETAAIFLDPDEESPEPLAMHPSAGATGNPGSFATFVGQPECGTWRLRVFDGAEFDEGYLLEWSLEFRTFAVSVDCNGNKVPDDCDIAAGTSGDCNTNGIPDDCEDCNSNGIADECDIAAGTSEDCNTNGVPDECDIGPAVSIGGGGTSSDCNSNGIPDECDISGGTSQDCNSNGLPDECDSYRDCNSNGTNDLCDIAGGLEDDCNNNGIPDACELAGTGGLYVQGLNTDNVFEFDAVSGAALGEFVESNAGGLDAPFSLAFGPNGNLFVGDSALPGVRQYDGHNGESIGVYATDLVLSQPVDLLFRPNGNLLVATLNFSAIVEIEAATGTINPFALDPALVSPIAMTFGPGGDVFVCSFGNGQVLRFDGQSGALVGPFATGGNLVTPMGLDFGPNGNLFVIDSTADSIQEFDGTTGAYLGDFVPDTGQTAQAFLGHMQWGPDGNLYVVHSATNSVLEYDGTSGALLAAYRGGQELVFPFDLDFRPAANDCNTNGIPDDCEDCNDNNLADSCDIAAGTSQDANTNGIPDECEGEDLHFALVITNDDDGIDAATALPASDADARNGDKFYVSVWGTDRGAVNTGLESVYVAIDFDPAMVVGVAIDHRPPFTSAASGTIDNQSGQVLNLGGTDAAASGVGIEPQWVRIAVVEFDAISCPFTADFALAEAPLSLTGITAVGRGPIDPSNILFTGGSLDLLIACPYDLSGDGFINAVDLGIFQQSWLKGLGEVGYNPDADFDCSGFVGAPDLGWFVQGWLEPCSSLTEAELPECRQCD